MRRTLAMAFATLTALASCAEDRATPVSDGGVDAGPDAPNIVCQNLDEAACKAAGEPPCRPLYGKHIQTGQTGYVGCYTAYQWVKGEWVVKGESAETGCTIDPENPDDCWTTVDHGVPDGWQFVMDCYLPQCGGDGGCWLLDTCGSETDASAD